MYKNILSSIAYSLSFDFGQIFDLSYHCRKELIPLFAVVLGIKIGLSLYKDCLK